MCLAQQPIYVRVPFPLPRFRRFGPGQVPVCGCGWPMIPEASDGGPSPFVFRCLYMRQETCTRDYYPAAFAPDDGCPPCPFCGEADDVSILPNPDGRGWHFNCNCGSYPAVGPVGDPAPVVPPARLTSTAA